MQTAVWIIRTCGAFGWK